MPDLLTRLLQAVDEPAARYHRLDRYYAGESPLSYLSPESVAALGNRLRCISVNVPGLLVNSVAERLRVTGFDGADVWGDWLANDLDQLSRVAHREALILGDAYVIVWADQSGRPLVTIESAHQMAVQTDPGTRRVTAAVKRWQDVEAQVTHAVLYLPDEIVRLQAPTLGATTTGFRVVETIGNPLGVVPVVHLRNASRLLDPHADYHGLLYQHRGRSEMSDVLDLTDALAKLMADMMVASEFTARPRRYATGIELAEDDDGKAVNPFPEGDRMLISEAEGSKFGQLPGSDLGGYETAIGTVMRQISAVSGLPEHMLGIGSDNPTSADSIRASEAALTARAEAKQSQFGRCWEQVARLMVAVANGVDPRSVDPQVQWADAATRSVAQEADAVVKLFAAGLLPRGYALRKLGYPEDEITAISATPTSAFNAPTTIGVN